MRRGILVLNEVQPLHDRAELIANPARTVVARRAGAIQPSGRPGHGPAARTVRGLRSSACHDSSPAWARPDSMTHRRPRCAAIATQEPAAMKIRSTTILSVRHRGVVAIGGDGQVTLGNTVMKADAVKIRRLLDGKVITGLRRQQRRRLRPAGTVRGQAARTFRPTCRAPRPSWPRNGAPIARCGGWKPCWPWSTRGTRCWSPAPAT